MAISDVLTVWKKQTLSWTAVGNKDLKCNCLAEKSGNNVSKASRGHKVLVASPVKQSEMCTTLCE